MVLDFSLIRGGGSNAGKGGMENEPRTDSRRQSMKMRKVEMKNLEENLKTEITNTKSEKIVIASEPEGQVQVRTQANVSMQEQVVATSASPGGKASGYDSGAIGQGGFGRVLNYGDGKGGNGAFAFIRQTIMRNIRYPEKARRMGLEGKVLLSFTLFETGIIKDVKVIRSSGFPILDESAKDALVKTKFSRKIPTQLFVILPVEYRLE
jgi:TonB family protein